MAESFEEKLVETLNTDFIVSEDLAAQQLIREIYGNLKSKGASELSISEHCWLQSIERIYGDKKASISNKVDWYMRIGHDLIKEEKELNAEEKAMLTSFRRVLDVSAKNNTLSTFFSELENAVESLLRLDFSQKSAIPSLLENDENDLLNYIVMTVEMIRERLGQSVVSGKVVRTIMSRVSDSGAVVTDEMGRIRFVNDKMEQILSKPNEELVGSLINNILTKDNELHPSFISKQTEKLEIQQLKVPSQNGEVDEWVYTFTPKVETDRTIKRMSELRAIIEDIASCDKSDVVRMNVLTEVLKSKFARIEQTTIPGVGLMQNGSNLRMLIDECLSDIGEQEEIDVIVDANENILYFGDDKKLKTVVSQLLMWGL